MPLFYQHQINETTRLGIWKIEETEAFFLKSVPLKREVSHPHKRLQHLAGRYLLPVLFEDFPLDEIRIADTRKPFLQTEQYHFSISHCGYYAAAIASTAERVGVDIELVTPKIEKIRQKFLGEAEWKLASKSFDNADTLGRYGLAEGDDLLLTSSVGLGLPKVVPNAQLLTILWSCKEAIFKWYGDGELDFRKHMQLAAIGKIDNDQLITLPFMLLKGMSQLLFLNSIIRQELVLTWLNTRSV
jgi:4'-phosphopantetheinyl transferase